MPILHQFYDKIHVPESELTEYDKHGAGKEIRALTDSGLLVVHQVTAPEGEAAKGIAEEIAGHRTTRIKIRLSISRIGIYRADVLDEIRGGNRAFQAGELARRRRRNVPNLVEEIITELS